jgi:hypothetical protein
MPVSLPPRARPAPAGESFLLKSILLGSIVWLGAFVVVAAEVRLSLPNVPLSQFEDEQRSMAEVSLR